MNLPRTRGRRSAGTPVDVPALGISAAIAWAIGASVVRELGGGAIDTPRYLRRDLRIVRRRHAREPLDRPPKSLPERHGRSPSEPGPGLPNVRPPPRRIILGQGQVDEVQRGPDERGDGFGQLEKGDLLGVAQVEHLARESVIGGEPVDTLDQVVNEAEAPS